MRIRDASLSSIALFVTLAWVLVSPGAEASNNSFGNEIEGVYEAAVSKSTAREEINEEIEKVLAKMSFYKRPFARNQLQDGTEPCQEMSFEYDGDRISIRCDDQPAAVAKPDGSATSYTGEDGETHQLSITVANDRIIQVFDADRGSRTNTYQLRGDDTVVMSVRLDSSQLPEPITYSRRFERK